MASMAAFYETRNAFREQLISADDILSYEDWLTKSTGEKVARLFLQFFEQITLAWDKANQFDFIDSEEGVEIVLQYLEKQVCDRYIKGHPKKKVSEKFFNAHPDMCEEKRLIDEDRTKFSPAYIYKISYNCMYCICHDRKIDKDRWDNETTAIKLNSSGEEYNVLDDVSSGTAEEFYSKKEFESQFWEVIEDTGLCAEKAMRYLLSGDVADLKKLNCRNKNYGADPLEDVEVPLESLDSMLATLREKFLDLAATSACGQKVLSLPSFQ